MKTSVVIPNWNGRKLLEKNLPAIMAIRAEEVVIVDNGSEDDSVQFLEKKYSEIKLIKNKKNLGFAVACNQGFVVAEGEIVILLNNDVVPEKNLLEKTLPLFNDSKVFAVSFHEQQWSWAKIFWKNGFVEHEPGPKTDKTHLSAWASGGSGAFRRDIWQALGGFDSIYHPFYWEDIDLSYRAWKRGFKVLWEPRAIVYHQHEATIGKHFSREYVEFITRRNQLLFIWKNINSPKMLLEHKFYLLSRMKSLGFVKSLSAAFLQLPQVLLRKTKEIREVKVSDREIFRLFDQGTSRK